MYRRCYDPDVGGKHSLTQKKCCINFLNVFLHFRCQPVQSRQSSRRGRRLTWEELIILCNCDTNVSVLHSVQSTPLSFIHHTFHAQILTYVASDFLLLGFLYYFYSRGVHVCSCPRSVTNVKSQPPHTDHNLQFALRIRCRQH